MKGFILLITLISTLISSNAEDVRLVDLDPPEAQQQIESHDQSLHYAPKIQSNVPAVRYLGNEPHNVLEDIYSARQYHGQDGLGGYLYGYNIPDIAKTEKKVAGGDLTGAYNYVADTGDEIKVQYWDDGTGFHQVDNVGDLLKSKQVQDTPEVQAEKDKFLARWQEEAERNQKPVSSPYNAEGQYSSGPLSPQANSQSQYVYQPSSSSGVYQQSGGYTPYQQSVQYNKPESGQYYQASQSGYQQYQQPTESYQTSESHQSSAVQYQQPDHYSPAVVQHKSFAEITPNQVDYTGAYSENQNAYSNPAQNKPEYNQQGQNQPNDYSNYGHSDNSGQYNQQGQNQPNGYSNYGQSDNSGQYEKKWEENEETGPPKGFFYSFDYPVGKIVQNGEVAKVGDLHNVYSANKAKYEEQLNTAHP